MNRLLAILVLVAGLTGLCWVFPPFRVRSLKAVREVQEQSLFNPTAFTRKFWPSRLLPAATQATDVTKVLELASSEPGKVREQFGRTVGVGSSYYLFVRGTGRVMSVSEDEIGFSVSGEDGQKEVCVPLGLVFGNAVRDATSLIEASSYPNAQDFNDISAALNSIVETNVLPQLQQIARLGKRIQFAGCVEIADEDHDFRPLRLVPIFVKAE